MPTEDQYQEMIRRATRAGDTDAVNYFAGQIAKIHDTSSEPSLLGKVGRGMTAGAAKIGQTLLNIPVYAGVAPQEYRDFMQKSMDARKQIEQEGGLPGQFASLGVEIAGTGGLGGAARSLGTSVLPRTQRLLTPIAEGAASGVATSPENPLEGAGFGGVGGAVGAGVGKVAGGILKNLPQSKGAQQLKSEGVELTLGQSADPSSFAGRALETVERGLERIPGVGGALSRSRQAAYEQYPRTRIEFAREPHQTGPIVQAGDTVDDAVARQRQYLQGEYDTAYRGTTTNVADPQFQQSVQAIIDDNTLLLSPQERVGLMNNIQRYIYANAGPTGVVDGRMLQQMRNKMDELIDANKNSGNRVLALERVKGLLEGQFGMQNPNAANRIFNELPEGYRNLGTIEEAANKAVEQGSFSPAAFARQATKDWNPSLMQSSRSAASVLNRPNPPDTASLATWGLLGGLPLGGASVYYDKEPHAIAGTGALWGTGMLLGTKGGRRFLSGNTETQKRIAELIKQGKLPPASIVGGNLFSPE